MRIGVIKNGYNMLGYKKITLGFLKMIEHIGGIKLRNLHDD